MEVEDVNLIHNPKTLLHYNGFSRKQFSNCRNSLDPGVITFHIGARNCPQYRRVVYNFHLNSTVALLPSSFLNSHSVAFQITHTHTNTHLSGISVSFGFEFWQLSLSHVNWPLPYAPNCTNFHYSASYNFLFILEFLQQLMHSSPNK